MCELTAEDGYAHLTRDVAAGDSVLEPGQPLPDSLRAGSFASERAAEAVDWRRAS